MLVIPKTDVTNVKGRKNSDTCSALAYKPANLEDITHKCQKFDVVALKDCDFRQLHALPTLQHRSAREELVPQSTDLFPSIIIFLTEFLKILDLLPEVAPQICHALPPVDIA